MVVSQKGFLGHDLSAVETVLDTAGVKSGYYAAHRRLEEMELMYDIIIGRMGDPRVPTWGWMGSMENYTIGSFTHCTRRHPKQKQYKYCTVQYSTLIHNRTPVQCQQTPNDDAGDPPPRHCLPLVHSRVHGSLIHPLCRDQRAFYRASHDAQDGIKDVGA